MVTMNPNMSLLQDSSSLPSQLRLLLDMSSSTGRTSLPLPLRVRLPEAVSQPAVAAPGFLLQGLLQAAGTNSPSISHQRASNHGSSPSLRASAPDAGLASLKTDRLAGINVAELERALFAEPAGLPFDGISSHRSYSIQHEKDRMIQEYVDLTLAINEMKKHPVAPPVEPRFVSPLKPPKKPEEHNLVSERLEIAKDPHNKTPEQVFYILNVLGSTPRCKSEPYVDASGYVDPGTNRAVRGGIVELFPDKLYRMLVELEAEGNSEIASFLPHGRSFMVHKMEQFLSDVLPRFFSEQSKWSSFSRQLNLYGFSRCNSGPDAGSYFHELFLKGRPNLCNYMTRVGAPRGHPDRRKARLLDGGTDPDFYAMPLLKPQQPKARPK